MIIRLFSAKTDESNVNKLYFLMHFSAEKDIFVIFLLFFWEVCNQISRVYVGRQVQFDVREGHPPVHGLHGRHRRGRTDAAGDHALATRAWMRSAQAPKPSRSAPVFPERGPSIVEKLIANGVLMAVAGIDAASPRSVQAGSAQARGRIAILTLRYRRLPAATFRYSISNILLPKKIRRLDIARAHPWKRRLTVPYSSAGTGSAAGNSRWILDEDRGRCTSIRWCFQYFLVLRRGTTADHFAAPSIHFSDQHVRKRM